MKRYTAMDITEGKVITHEDILHNACCFGDWSGHVKVVVDNFTGEIVYAQGITLQYNYMLINSKGESLLISSTSKEWYEQEKSISKAFSAFCEQRFWEKA